MTRNKNVLGPERSARMKLNYSLSTRDRRMWAKRLMEAQEEIENATEKRDRLIAEAYEAGLAYSAIETATGLGPITVRNASNAYGRGTEEDQQGSS